MKYIKNTGQYLLLIMMVVLLFLAARNTERSEVSETVIHLENGIAEENMITTEEVHQIIKSYFGYDLTGTPAGVLDLNLVEEILEDNPFIKEAQVWLGRNGKLHIKSFQRHPVVRISTAGIKGYLDYTGKLMPLSTHYSARVPIINGYPRLIEDHADSLTTSLISVINRDPFYSALLSQIVIKRDGVAVMSTTDGDYKIVADLNKDPEGQLKKFKKLHKKTSLNTFQTIDLRYKDQVVCKKEKLS